MLKCFLTSTSQTMNDEWKFLRVKKKKEEAQASNTGTDDYKNKSNEPCALHYLEFMNHSTCEYNPSIIQQSIIMSLA